jgi:hypothetical protein
LDVNPGGVELCRFATAAEIPYGLPLCGILAHYWLDVHNDAFGAGNDQVRVNPKAMKWPPLTRQIRQASITFMKDS